MENVISLAVHRKPVEEPKPVDVTKPTEVLREVKTFHAECLCPKCGEGFMRVKSLQELMATMPQVWPARGTPQYPHVCSEETCKHEQSYAETYPVLRYKHADE